MSYGINLADLHKMVWLGDGHGNFANPDASLFNFTELNGQNWTPFFIDANNDGALDVVAVQSVFGEDYAVRNIGEQVAVFFHQA